MIKTLLVLMPASLGLYVLYTGAAQMGDGHSLVAGSIFLCAAYIITAIVYF